MYLYCFFSLYGAIFQVWQYDSKKSLRFFIHTFKTEERYCTKFYLFFYVAFTSFIPMEMVAKLCHSAIYISQYHSTKSSASSKKFLFPFWVNYINAFKNSSIENARIIAARVDLSKIKTFGHISDHSYLKHIFIWNLAVLSSVL